MILDESYSEYGHRPPWSPTERDPDVSETDNDILLLYTRMVTFGSADNSNMGESD